MLANGKAWIVLLVLPMVALLPDCIYMLMQKIFFPTPTDAVMLRQARQPDFFFDGFSEVFCPMLPGDPAYENELLMKRHPHHLKRDGNSAESDTPLFRPQLAKTAESAQTTPTNKSKPAISSIAKKVLSHRKLKLKDEDVGLREIL